MAGCLMAPTVVVVIVNLLVLGVTSQCPNTGVYCTPCITGCDVCPDDVSCTTCSSGYYLNPDTTTTCNECPTKCLVCSTPYACDKCTPGYDKTTDGSTGYEYCTFIWWKWFLIVFGVLLGLVLIGVMIWWIRSKLKAEDEVDKQVNYQMKKRYETTQQNIA